MIRRPFRKPFAKPIIVASVSLGALMAAGARADLTVPLAGQKDAPRPAAQGAGAPAPARTAGKPARATAPVRPTPLQRALQAGVIRRDLASRGSGSVLRRGIPVLPAADGSFSPGALEMPTPDAASPPSGAAPIPVNGRLGRVIENGTDVHRMPDAASPWVAKLGRSQQVAVISQWNGWYAIMMGDGSQAYVPKPQIELLPYAVKSVVPASPTNTNIPIGGAGGGLQGASPLGRAVLAEAFRYRSLGTPYVWGGNSERGIDCSGLVKNCFAAQGIQLPRTVGPQEQIGQPVPLDQLQPGDRLYFAVRRPHDHTGIYIGDGYFIHASSGRGRVDIDHLSQRLYSRALYDARRL